MGLAVEGGLEGAGLLLKLCLFTTTGLLGRVGCEPLSDGLSSLGQQESMIKYPPTALRRQLNPLNSMAFKNFTLATLKRFYSTMEGCC